MAIDPIKIPQDVGIEDRIIGPITLRQLIISLIGTGVSYAIWSSMKNEYGGGVPLDRTIMAWIPCVIFIAFAFVRINGVSLFRMMLLGMEKTDKPAIRTWSPREGISMNVSSFEDTKQKPTKDMPDQNAEELSKLMDTGLDDLEAIVQRKRQRLAAEAALDNGDLLPAEPQVNSNLPVQRGRISVDSSANAKPVDDVQAPEQVQPSVTPTVRDISPPPSN